VRNGERFLARRPDQTVTQQRVDELNAVRGWIQPVFTRHDPLTGKPHRLITEEDGRKIAAGYACGECGAIFDIVRVQCPVCHTQMGLVEEPMREEWLPHLRDRMNGDAPPVARNPFADRDEFFRQVAADPDVEHRKL
jgi:hypothetical protein